jgi:hypothetical protein
MELIIGQEIHVKAQFTHEDKVARVTGAVTWGSTNPAVLEVTPNGFSAIVKALAVGDAQVTLSAPAGANVLNAILDCAIQLPLATAAAIVVVTS